MWKSILYAVGIFLLILGAQTLVIDKWIMSSRTAPVASTVANSRRSPFSTANYSRPSNNGYYSASNSTPRFYKPLFQTQEWMPWSLLAAGAITVLYGYSINRSGSE